MGSRAISVAPTPVAAASGKAPAAVPAPESPKEQRLARQVDRQVTQALQQHNSRESAKVKLVVLGARHAGKTTVLKQLRRMYGQQQHWCDPDDWNSKMVVWRGMVHATGVFAARTGAGLDLPAEHLLTWPDVDAFLAFYRDKLGGFVAKHEHELPDEFGLDFLVHETLPLMLEKRNAWTPSHADVLRASTPRAGVTKECFNLDGVSFEVADVSLQSGSASKYEHMFNDVTSLVFVHNCAAQGDDLTESLLLWDKLTSSTHFRHLSFILLLNKKDVLAQFLARGGVFEHGTITPTGGLTDQTAVETALLGAFLSSAHNHEVYQLFTTMTDPAVCLVTFNACKDIILKNNLTSSGFMD